LSKLPNTLKLFITIVVLSSLPVKAQFTDFHPELNWYTIKGEHCVVHFHEGAERTARVVAKIADEVWSPITSLYDYEPEPVHFIIKDIDDYSNGATYFFDNKIEIWSSALDFELRGFHNWLRNVISHEFTHMVQIQASLKTKRTIPAVYLQWLNYEDERRPDILYGFPNVIASYPLAMVNMPSWFAEGTAQYMRKDFGYEKWDAHRDMILRSYALDNNMLSWEQMGIFDKTSLGNESVYNSGYALTRYIAQKYGETKIAELTKKLGKLTNFTMDAACEDALGISGKQLYNEWSDYVKANYKERISKVLENKIVGDTIGREGFGNFYPVFSSDQQKIYYISNQGSDYLSLSSLYEYDLKTKKEKIVVPGIRSTISQIPGTNKLLFSKLTEDNPGWANVHDLFVYDMTTEKETRLTHDLRATNPSISRDGKNIVFTFQKDGSGNIAIVNAEGKNFKQLTVYGNGEQVFNPQFSPDGEHIIFDYAYSHGRDIAMIDTSGANNKFILNTACDERNPTLDNQGNLIFSSDKTGIFDIYRYNMKSKEMTQLTNVTGGAFMPAVDSAGNIVYAGYTSAGYKLFYITVPEQAKVKPENSYVALDNPPLGDDKPKGDLKKFNMISLQQYDDYKLPDMQKTPYKGAFSKLTFFPFVRYDNYNTSNKFGEKIKPGVYVTSSDMLNRYEIFGGASLNTRMERDLFFSFAYRNKLPLLFDMGIKPELSLEVYSVSRKSGEYAVEIEGYKPTHTDVTYNLFEVDVIAKHRIISRYHSLTLKYTFNTYSATTGSFYIVPEFNGDGILSSAFSDTYLIGSVFEVKYNYDFHLPYIDDDINPIANTLELKYDYELNRFNPDNNYTYSSDGSLVAQYNHYNFNRLELNSQITFPVIKNHTLTLKVRGGTILGPNVPDFFDFYLGGLIGMRPYPFYSLSGNEVAWLNLTYRFPLWKNIDARLGHIYLDKIFFSVYGDYGNAWNGDIVKINDFKKGAGAEIRIAMNSFYLFPTSVFFNASYGFDSFTRTTHNNTAVTYGKEMRYYAGILFGFDI
jgi:Tol biopolymer transport system component